MSATDAAAPKIGQWTKLALDLGPLAVFFAANAWFDIWVATGAVMAACTVAVALSFWLERKLSPIPLVTLVMVLVFGGLTLWLADETFIKMRPTIVYTLLGSVLLVGLWAGRPLLKYVMSIAVQLEERAWPILTLRWGVFFLVLAVINEIVWRSTETDTWVFYNTWGDLALTFLFAIAQTPLLMRYQIEEKSEDRGEAKKEEKAS